MLQKDNVSPALFPDLQKDVDDEGAQKTWDWKTRDQILQGWKRRDKRVWNAK